MQTENFQGKEDQYHGNLGEMIVSNLNNNNPSCDAWIQAANEYGHYSCRYFRKT